MGSRFSYVKSLMDFKQVTKCYRNLNFIRDKPCAYRNYMLIYTGIELDIAKILHDRKEMVTAYTPKSVAYREKRLVEHGVNSNKKYEKGERS